MENWYYIRAGNKGEFLSRPRIVAIREFAPNNILYYEGDQYRIDKTRLPVKGITYNKIAICHNCGYLHDGDDFQRDTCHNCGARLTGDDRGNVAKLDRVLEMDNAIARKTNRITCDEEERLKYGYKLATYFRYATGKKRIATVQTEDGKELLRLSYGETADIWRVNRGLSRSNEKGFQLDTASGEWVGKENDKNRSTEKIDSNVHLTVKDTSNILIIEPLDLPEANTEAYIITLQYALERGIQAFYKLENNELVSERIGTGKSLLFWEAAEGGAGVLSQILADPQSFSKLAKEALDICHFLQPKDSCYSACYQCLLSYSNQFDHPHLDRHLIHSFLQQLENSQLVCQLIDVDRQYQLLLQQTDPNSSFEREVLTAIYEGGIKLPDSAQELIPEAQCKPDFLYKKERVAIFCDGSIHDFPERQKQDKIQREDLRYLAGYEAISFNYREDLFSRIDLLRSLVKNDESHI